MAPYSLARFVKKKFTYSKFERLDAGLVQQVLQGGSRFFVSPFRVYWSLQVLKSPGVNSPRVRMSVLIGKRIFPLASKRNRVRRIIIEAYRLNRLRLHHVLPSLGANMQLCFIINLVKDAGQMPDENFKKALYGRVMVLLDELTRRIL